MGNELSTVEAEGQTQSQSLRRRLGPGGMYSPASTSSSLSSRRNRGGAATTSRGQARRGAETNESRKRGRKRQRRGKRGNEMASERERDVDFDDDDDDDKSNRARNGYMNGIEYGWSYVFEDSGDHGVFDSHDVHENDLHFGPERAEPETFHIYAVSEENSSENPSQKPVENDSEERILDMVGSRYAMDYDFWDDYDQTQMGKGKEEKGEVTKRRSGRENVSSHGRRQSETYQHEGTDVGTVQNRKPDDALNEKKSRKRKRAVKHRHDSDQSGYTQMALNTTSAIGFDNPTTAVATPSAGSIATNSHRGTNSSTTTFGQHARRDRPFHIADDLESEPLTAKRRDKDRHRRRRHRPESDPEYYDYYEKSTGPGNSGRDAGSPVAKDTGASHIDQSGNQRGVKTSSSTVGPKKPKLYTDPVRPVLGSSSEDESSSDDDDIAFRPSSIIVSKQVLPAKQSEQKESPPMKHREPEWGPRIPTTAARFQDSDSESDSDSDHNEDHDQRQRELVMNHTSDSRRPNPAARERSGKRRKPFNDTKSDNGTSNNGKENIINRTHDSTSTTTTTSDNSSTSPPMSQKPNTTRPQISNYPHPPSLPSFRTSSLRAQSASLQTYIADTSRYIDDTKTEMMPTSHVKALFDLLRAQHLSLVEYLEDDKQSRDAFVEKVTMAVDSFLQGRMRREE